jgi:outer membrane protein OmpA-like peptidoglycan-associated protein
MDDGWRGYMDPRIDKNGNPVCRKGGGGTRRDGSAAVIDGARDALVPTIWVDPDGCEHWVMDDGQRGYMDARVDRKGKPVCRRGASCAVLPADQLFAVGSATIGAAGKSRLVAFFRSAGARGYTISGHTDSSGGDAANMRLSEARAEAVARIARANGARVLQVVPYGERDPKASNATQSGRAKNRRVEIFCVN